MFALKEGEISTPQRVARGWVIGTVSGRQDPYVPALDEVKDRVRDDVVREKAAELAKQRAAAHRRRAEERQGLRRHRQEAQASRSSRRELLARGAAIPDIGMSDAVDAAAFSLPLNGVSDPISTPSATAIVRVVERQDVTDAQIAAGRDELREEMTGTAARPLLQRLHAEGEDGPEDQHQPGHAGPGAGPRDAPGTASHSVGSGR